MYVVYAYKTPAWIHNIQLNMGWKKYLGLLIDVIDEKLTWKSNMLLLQGKLRKLNYLFHYRKNHFRKKRLKKLYGPLYESVLTYGIIHGGFYLYNPNESSAK